MMFTSRNPKWRRLAKKKALGVLALMLLDGEEKAHIKRRNRRVWVRGWKIRSAVKFECEIWLAEFASHYCTKCCRWWIHEEICCAQCCRSRTRFYCCNIARNIARNKFWGGYTMQFSHCAQHCAQYCTVYPDLNTDFTITAEIRARSLANFYCQYADRQMNLTFTGRVSKRERTIWPFVIVKNKLMSVFNGSVLLLTMNFVITLPK